jgi:hypothetical protein
MLKFGHHQIERANHRLLPAVVRENGIPYQTLLNLDLRDCAVNQRSSKGARNRANGKSEIASFEAERKAEVGSTGPIGDSLPAERQCECAG